MVQDLEILVYGFGIWAYEAYYSSAIIYTRMRDRSCCIGAHPVDIKCIGPVSNSTNSIFSSVYQSPTSPSTDV